MQTLRVSHEDSSVMAHLDFKEPLHELGDQVSLGRPELFSCSEKQLLYSETQQIVDCLFGNDTSISCIVIKRYCMMIYHCGATDLVDIVECITTAMPELIPEPA